MRGRGWGLMSPLPVSVQLWIMLLLRPHNRCSRGALYTGVSVLVALLLAGQATTAYFLYQQQGRLDKLTVTSQNLQLESLRMKLPKCACSTYPSPHRHHFSI